jgi:hypothetical protein
MWVVDKEAFKCFCCQWLLCWTSGQRVSRWAFGDAAAAVDLIRPREHALPSLGLPRCGLLAGRDVAGARRRRQRVLRMGGAGTRRVRFRGFGMDTLEQSHVHLHLTSQATAKASKASQPAPHLTWRSAVAAGS